MTVDDDVVIIGTCNWDIRSLLLHDEVVSVFYDEPIATANAARYEEDITACSTVTGGARTAQWSREAAQLGLSTPVPTAVTEGFLALVTSTKRGEQA